MIFEFFLLLLVWLAVSLTIWLAYGIAVFIGWFFKRLFTDWVLALTLGTFTAWLCLMVHFNDGRHEGLAAAIGLGVPAAAAVATAAIAGTMRIIGRRRASHASHTRVLPTLRKPRQKD
jgi:hypothetical protein